MLYYSSQLGVELLELFESDILIVILIHVFNNHLLEILVICEAMLLNHKFFAVIDRHLAGALGVHLLPHVSHDVIEDVGGGKTRVGAVVRLALPVRLDELAKIFEAHAIPEVFVHDAELLVPAPVASRPDSGVLERRCDLIPRDRHLFGLGALASGTK